ncbi:MAG: substrate-binding domain-containing protein [Acidimicrobiales bacterium]
MSHGCPTTTFWPPVWNGAADAGHQLGVNVHVLHITTSECGNTEAEVKLLETAIAAHPAGIATTVTDATSFSSALQTAKSDHIPVVVFNSAPTSTGQPSSTNPYDSFIGQNNQTAGAGSAKEAVKMFHLAKGASVAVVDHEPTNISLTQRLTGIKSAFKSYGITPTVVNTTTSVSTGAATVAAYLSKNHTTQAILTMGTTGTTQVTEALKTDNLKIKIGGMDLDSTTLADIKSGVVSYTVDQQPYLQGYMSIVELFLDATEGVAPESFSTGPAFLTATNVNSLSKYVTHTGY